MNIKLPRSQPSFNIYTDIDHRQCISYRIWSLVRAVLFASAGVGWGRACYRCTVHVLYTCARTLWFRIIYRKLYADAPVRSTAPGHITHKASVGVRPIAAIPTLSHIYILSHRTGASGRPSPERQRESRGLARGPRRAPHDIESTGQERHTQQPSTEHIAISKIHY